MAHSRDKRTGMNRQQNLCLIPVRLYPFCHRELHWSKNDFVMLQLFWALEQNNVALCKLPSLKSIVQHLR